MSHIQAPLSRPKHMELLHEINKMNIEIKISHLLRGELRRIAEEGLGECEPPTWEMVVALLNMCYKAIEEQREEVPLKY